MSTDLVHSDLNGEAPWAMQIVLNVDKNSPATRAHLCAAAATAVARLVSDPRCLPDGPWFDAVTRWTDGRIRKHSRRARGNAWLMVQSLEGVTAISAGASARAFVPTCVTDIPTDVRKLQLSGSEPTALGPRHIDARIDGPLVVSISTEPELSLGKAAAAAGHAAQIALSTMDAQRRTTWLTAGCPVVVEHPLPRDWAAAQAQAQVRIADAGFTEIAPGTVTAVARWL
jgi:peptidyl-tRNA hydrolase